MASIREMKARIEKLDTDQVVEQSMNDAKEGMADLNVEQMNKGMRADGREMPDYSPFSVDFFGKPEGPIKLYDTGAFYRGVNVKIEGGKVIYSSTDEKAEMLTERYDKEIFGLEENFKFEAIEEHVKPAFKRRMEEATKLKLL